jgi:hypothetical protein
VKRPGNSAANIDLVRSCMYTRFHNFHSSRSRHNIPLFAFQSPTHSSVFLVHNLIPSPFVAYALLAKDAEGTPVRVALLKLQHLPPFCPELSTPHGELLLAPSCNSLVSSTYKLPPRKSFACSSYKNERGGAIPRSNPSRHQLQSSVCPTCPRANGEVSG